VVCGVFLGLEAVARIEPRRRLLALATVVSLFHTVPWIALNASLDRSLDRFKTLPLGGGRTESTVGYWYATHGQLAEAEQWLMRALDANSGNSRAHYLLGQVYMSTGRYPRAVAAFSAARIQRPDLELFRLALIDALVMSGRDGPALAEIDTLLGRDASQAAHWAIRGVILMGLERRDEAHSAVVHAIELAPREASYREILRQVDAPGSYREIVREHWAALMGG